MTIVERILIHCGLTQVARACKVSLTSVYRWRDRGYLPRTEWTGETEYAKRIAALHCCPYTVEEILSEPPRPGAKRKKPRLYPRAAK